MESIFEEMATYARNVNQIETKQLEDDLETFVHQGNLLADFDPSDIDDDDDQDIEEEENAMEDAMGDDDIELLKKFFLTSAEMADDKQFRGSRKKRTSQADIWAKILPELRSSTPSLAKVIELMIVIPSSTAEVERFFKVLKEMKSKKRNRLSAKKLRKMFLIYYFLDLENYDKERVHKLFEKHLNQ